MPTEEPQGFRSRRSCGRSQSSPGRARRLCADLSVTAVTPPASSAIPTLEPRHDAPYLQGPARTSKQASPASAPDYAPEVYSRAVRNTMRHKGKRTASDEGLGGHGGRTVPARRSLLHTPIESRLRRPRFAMNLALSRRSYITVSTHGLTDGSPAPTRTAIHLGRCRRSSSRSSDCRGVNGRIESSWGRPSECSRHS